MGPALEPPLDGIPRPTFHCGEFQRVGGSRQRLSRGHLKLHLPKSWTRHDLLQPRQRPQSRRRRNGVRRASDNDDLRRPRGASPHRRVLSRHQQRHDFRFLDARQPGPGPALRALGLVGLRLDGFLHDARDWSPVHYRFEPRRQHEPLLPREGLHGQRPVLWTDRSRRHVGDASGSGCLDRVVVLPNPRSMAARTQPSRHALLGGTLDLRRFLRDLAGQRVRKCALS